MAYFCSQENFKATGIKGVYINYEEGDAGEFYKFFKKDFVAQWIIELNIYWV